MPRQTSHIIAPKDGSGPQKPARPRDPVASGERDAAQNRAASHNYFLLENSKPAWPSAEPRSNPSAKVKPT